MGSAIRLSSASSGHRWSHLPSVRADVVRAPIFECRLESDLRQGVGASRPAERGIACGLWLDIRPLRGSFLLPAKLEAISIDGTQAGKSRIFLDVSADPRFTIVRARRLLHDGWRSRRAE